MELETIIRGKNAGPRLAIFAGIHGNETIGVRAFEKLLPNISIDIGEVNFVIANPLAIEKGKRQVNANMNRIFKDKTGDTLEHERVSQLKNILDQVDALLDIHAFNDLEGEPFIICRPDLYDLAAKLPFKIVSSGWNKTHPGSTDWYMETLGKPGLGIECGSVHKTEEYVHLAISAIYGFLKYFGCINEIPIEYQFEIPKQIFVEVKEQIIKKTDAFKFAREFHNFGELKEGELIATDGDIQYFAKEGQFVLFPREDKPIGGEVFLIGKGMDGL